MHLSDHGQFIGWLGAVSQVRKRTGTSSYGFAVHHQQMNRALLSSVHGARGISGGWSAVLSAARVATDGGPSLSNCDQSMWLIGLDLPPWSIQRQVLATRLCSPNSLRCWLMANSMSSRGRVIAGGSGRDLYRGHGRHLLWIHDAAWGLTSVGGFQGGVPLASQFEDLGGWRDGRLGRLQDCVPFSNAAGWESSA